MGIIVDNARLPEHLETGAEIGPTFNTSLISLASGAEQANANWQDERLTVDASYGIMDKESGYDPEDSYYAILSFFRARMGKHRGFLFRDPTDYEADQELLFKIPTQSNPDRYQLCKNYGTYQRRITRIDAATLHLYDAEGEVINPSKYQLFSLGRIQFAEDVEPAGITASFEFFVPMRFEKDALAVTLKHIRAGQIPSINLIQVRE